ncbi:MAG: hypothetical protein V3S45_00140, partial [Kiloniellales bacterium]
ASPTGPPTDPDAELLGDRFLTSWATVARAAAAPAHYVAQPEGSSLFGRDPIINPQHQALLGPEDPGYQLPAEALFPMPPYAGVVPADNTQGTTFSRQEIDQFERQVLSPTRRTKIGAPPGSMSRRATLFGEAEVTTKPVTTPAGVIAQVVCENGDCTWQSILLGKNLNPPRDGSQLELEFEDPDPKLQQAFQTNSLFLVAANACNLGEMTGWPKEPDSVPFCPQGEPASTGTFLNRMNIEDWVLAANVGVENRYNDYRNVLIVKGREGLLWDPDEEAATGLVQNPDLWTQRGDFSSPTYLAPDGQNPDKDKLQPPDPNQQIILAQWLHDYFRNAFRQESEFFENFNKNVVTNPRWTGILMLRLDIQALPDDLQGILAGVRDPESFQAHHFGVSISPVDATVQLDKSSSMFGLIYYVDPEFDDSAEDPQPVAPTAGVPYDFITLTLQVLFENTAIRNFRSATQLTVNDLFDQSVEMGEAGNRFNSIILRGTYQNNNGQPMYSMASTSDNQFFFDSNVLEKVEIDNVLMTTIEDQGGVLVIWFAMSGFIDYKVVLFDDQDCREESEGAEPLAFDVFSFGQTPGDTGSVEPKGLAFSNLGLEMKFRLDETDDSGAPKKYFRFVIDEMLFNVDTSTPRKDSLFLEFVLDLEGIVRGTAESPPSSRGYLPVLTAAPMAGVDGSSWFGLRYKLSMGSPGALAGKAGLNSFLLIAWSPDSTGLTYKTTVAIELPGTGGGAKLISLQNVLKLSIGQIWLNRALRTDGQGRSWLLLLSEIALKFLGLLKIPPGGTSTFYLFGNPGGDSASGLGWYAIFKKDETSSDALLNPQTGTTTGELEATYQTEGN